VLGNFTGLNGVRMNQPVKMREGFQPKGGPVTATTPEPPIAPPPEPEAETWPVKIKLLHRPVNDGRTDVRELSFREPTGADINRCGNPVRVDQYGEIIIDERKMTNMMAQLSGVLLPMLERMDPRDWNSCAYRLRVFFLPDPAAW